MQPVLSEKAEVLVRFNEADPLGIVWHGNYIRYFEDGRKLSARNTGCVISTFSHRAIRYLS